jgi:hypothetical protein
MQQQTAKRLTAIFGVTMAVIMGLSVILPSLGQNVAQNPQTIQPTEAPIPTFPAPIDNNLISFDQLYLHPTGLFTVAQPSGWANAAPSNNIDNARVTFTNPQALSVIQVDVQKPSTTDADGDGANDTLTLDDVDAFYNTTYLEGSWRTTPTSTTGWTDWKEAGQRKRENDKLTMDFELSLNRQTYVARQTAWTDGDLIYSVRVVTPENATNQLLYLLDSVAATLTPSKENATTPFDWNAHVDSVDKYLIRFPPSWTLADSAPGLPASITNGRDVVLRVETEGGTAADEAAARAWVEAERPGATILSVQPVTRGANTGFAVAYSFKNVDGDSQSGVALLLNGTDKLYVANLRFPGADVDLNNADTQAAYPDYVSALDSFKLVTDLTLPEATAEPVS